MTKNKNFISTSRLLLDYTYVEGKHNVSMNRCWVEAKIDGAKMNFQSSRNLLGSLVILAQYCFDALPRADAGFLGHVAVYEHILLLLINNA